MRKYRNDIILIGVILILAIIGLILLFSCSNNNNLMALVYYDNNVILEIDLSVDKEYTVSGKISDITILINDSKLSVVESACEDKICINQGYISRANQTITCLPNEIYIKIVSKKAEVDVVV